MDFMRETPCGNQISLANAGLDPGARAMAVTLACVERYLNARRLVCWLDKVIADPAEINQVTCTGASALESERNDRAASATNQVDEDQQAVFAGRTLGC